MVASACAAVVTVPEPSERSDPYSCLSSLSTSIAPGTVMVTSTTVTPPAIMAFTIAWAWAALRARRTGMSPTRSMVSCVVSGIFSSIQSGLSGDARRPAFDDAFHFSQCGHAGVAGGGHGKRAVGHAAADSPVNRLASKQAVNQPGSKAVAAAYTVKNVDVALGHMDDPILIERNRAPGIAAGCVRGAQ